MKYTLCSRRRRAFTLVELLVVIAIIGVLIALLLPAVQAAREAARRMQCQNHLKQMALAMLGHESAHRFFPSGGWGHRWTGDPDRGTGFDQPGGWSYAILPYIEQKSVHAFGRDNQPDTVTSVQIQGARRREAIPMEGFICPSRRAAKVYPRPANRLYYNGGNIAEAIAIDYAANYGSNAHEGSYGQGPRDMEAALRLDWSANFSQQANGVCHCHSQIPLDAISDGTTSTYMLGEKYLNPDTYETGLDGTDDHGVYEGCSADTCRWCCYDAANPAASLVPKQDQSGVALWWSFGSAHPATCNFVMCDGSARSVSYEIDPYVHSLLGNREDGITVPANEIR
ncbi:MAG: DUF1559 domain-containing protein [Pirellulales bacterium]|nr:DUF1559 domain-containing protein [Pirellulales bacterium]